MILTVGEPPTARFSIEMSSSSDISSRSRVPVEVAKPWPCSMEVYSLVHLLFSFPSLPHAARSSSGRGLDGYLFPTFSFRLLRLLDSLFQPWLLISTTSESSWSFLQKDPSLIFFCFFGISFLEPSLSLGTLDSSRLILTYCFLLFTHLICLLPYLLSWNLWTVVFHP